MKPILAILVLYRMPLAESPTYRTLHAAFQADPPLAAAIDLVVADNSPQAQALPADFAGRYLHDGENPGLARRYNQALRLASEQQSPWLLLLDQDTTLSTPYLREMVSRTRELTGDHSIVAVVPKLIQDGEVQSPHERPTFRHTRFDAATTGRAKRLLYAFNSASALRTSRLAAVGGFPEEFWLDFLDHATFHLLQQDGSRLFLLRASLEHELSANSTAAKDEPARRRYRNILDAEYTFYRRYGSAADRFYRRVRMMRGCLGNLIMKRRFGESLVMLRAALRR